MESVSSNAPYTGALGAENTITVTAPPTGTVSVSITRGSTQVQSATLSNGATATYGPYNLDTQFRLVVSSGKATVSYQEGLINLTGQNLYTVAMLPVGVKGASAFVTDATSPTFNAAVVGGGTVTVPVFHNGTAWTVG